MIPTLEKRKQAEFTEKQIGQIYAFLEQYVPDEKINAKREIMSMLRYDRYLYKHRIEKKLYGAIQSLEDVL